MRKNDTRYTPTKEEKEKPIHLPGRSPEAVAKIIMQSGAQRRPLTINQKQKGKSK